MAPSNRLAAAPLAITLALALLLLLAQRAAAMAAPPCALGLDAAEVDRLGAALAADPGRYLEFAQRAAASAAAAPPTMTSPAAVGAAAGGGDSSPLPVNDSTHAATRRRVVGVRAAALIADGFSERAVECLRRTHGGMGVGGWPSGGARVSDDARGRALAFFSSAANQQAWHATIARRFGAAAARPVTNARVRAALASTYAADAPPPSLLAWLAAALAEVLPPELQLLGPVVARELEAAMAAAAGAAPSGGGGGPTPVAAGASAR